jgi:hypothetical protein
VERDRQTQLSLLDAAQIGLSISAAVQLGNVSELAEMARDWPLADFAVNLLFRLGAGPAIAVAGLSAIKTGFELGSRDHSNTNRRGAERGGGRSLAALVRPLRKVNVRIEILALDSDRRRGGRKLPQFILSLVSASWRLAKLGRPQARLMLRYETTIVEIAEALILGYGRFREMRGPVGSDPHTNAQIERFSSDGREVVLLGFRNAAAASDFQRFWARYSRLYGPAYLRDPAYHLPAPVLAIDAASVTASSKVVPLAGPVATAQGESVIRPPMPDGAASPAPGREGRRAFLGGPVFRWRPGGRDSRRPDLRTTLDEMESAGVLVRAVELTPDGTIRLVTASHLDAG